MKYWRTFLLTIQTELQYRANSVLWIIEGAIAPVVMVLAWFVVLGNRSEVGGYTRGDFITYYLAVTFGWYVVAGTFSQMIGRAIKMGEMNITLVKPYNVVLEKMVREQAWKFISLLIALPILAVVTYMFRSYVTVSLSGVQIFMTMVSFALGAILFAIIEATIGILAFWFVEIWPIADTSMACMNVFGGMLAPLTLMPIFFQRVAAYLPFKYVFFVPVSMLLGKADNPSFELGLQVIFIVICFGIYSLIWRAGLKRYEGIGG